MTDIVPVKGYLKGAWDFAAALISNPKQAFEDFKHGWSVSARTDDRMFKPHNSMLGYGSGLAVSGLILSSTLSLGTVPLGLGLALLGAGRYHALGEGERLAIEAEDKVFEDFIAKIEASEEEAIIDGGIESLMDSSEHREEIGASDTPIPAEDLPRFVAKSPPLTPTIPMP